VEQRFRRIHDSLSAGVDLKRRVVEELRPTLLDNMGLFAALRWQFRETCRRHGMRCTEKIPDVEMKFSPDAAIGVFRIAQEALTNILKHAEAHAADIAVDLSDRSLTLRVSDDGKGLPNEVIADGTGHGLAAMRHRVMALGGSCAVSNRSGGGTLVEATIPLSRMLIERA
jgi:signal transduction histidine kinase